MFLLSDFAKKKLKREKRLRFWVFSPVIMLITHKAHESSNAVIRPHIVSANKLAEQYKKKIVEINGLRILPHIDVLLNTANADEWLLDVASDDTFVLIADGKRIDPCRWVNEFAPR